MWISLCLPDMVMLDDLQELDANAPWRGESFGDVVGNELVLALLLDPAERLVKA